MGTVLGVGIHCVRHVRMKLLLVLHANQIHNSRILYVNVIRGIFIIPQPKFAIVITDLINF